MTREQLAFQRVTPDPGPDADAQRHEWVARCTAAEDGHLEVGGIATVWDLLVDGEVVRSGRSAFERHTVAVPAGAHEVRVVVHPLTALLDEQPRKPRQRWRTMLVEDARLRWVRTPVLGRAPGFSPGPPVVGPYQPVTLVTGERPRPRLRARLEGTTGVVEVDGRDRLTFPDAELWWPHTHGTPHLHDVVVDGELLGRVGFRTLENRDPDSLDLWLNGVRIFVRGAVWTPGDLAALDEAVALGLNLVRVSGIAAYESEEFHARCDELGLLVWQDLMFATFDYPLADASFVETVEAEVREQVTRVAAHPSTVVVCGSAEHEQQATMFGLARPTGAEDLAALLRPVVEATGTDAVWVDSSPSGGDLPIRVDRGIAQYFGVGAYLRDLPDARHSGVRFAAECLAFSNLPDPPTEEGVPQDNGADWDFADVRRHYLHQRYGPDATVEQAQRVTGEVMADVFGEWRRPTSTCRGGIVLWLRDLVPGAGWGLLDHTGKPKPAALALAPVLQPTAVWLVDEGLNGLDVHIAHDRDEPLDAVLRLSLLREDGSELDAVESRRRFGLRGHVHWSVEIPHGRFTDVSYAYRFGPPPHHGVRAVLTWDGGRSEATWTIPWSARR